MPEALTIQRFSGAALVDYLDDVARLRIEVFREFPYLYDGSMGYERHYLRTYVNCADAVVVVAFADGAVVGASTGIPMRAEEASFQQPFIAAGYDPARVFYCAESVLRRDYRGLGLGVRFFGEREAHARALGGFDYAVFCAVVRPPEHPLRPSAYQPLDRFWEKRGYRKHPELRAHYAWKDVDQAERTSKALEFWVKSLAP
ncbi:MAG: GNAT family N-acetyltransferase [Pseudomonadales bacterium]|jgi:GNAT superfamily N-acetyltransferase|nr:GNAT family N-acetyltransferase [Pseudomonadales bacterium]